MKGTDHRHRIVRFGVYEMDREACELRRSGQRIPLQIQPFRVLEALVDRAGDVVTRAELRARVWPSTVYVDFDHGLNSAMTRLRHALEDSADAPKLIETLPRVGYRFIHPDVDDKGVPAPERVPSNRQWAAPSVGTVAAVILVAALGIGVVLWSGGERVVQDSMLAPERPTASAEAYDAYLRGIEFFEHRNKESIQRSIELLTRATELDSSFAAAHAALAMAYVSAGGSNSLVKCLSAGDVFARALAAAERALQLHPSLAQGHIALAVVLNGLQPWSAATDVAIEQAYRRAIELDGALASAHLFFGNFLSTRGRGEEAIQHYRRALELDSLSPSINSRLGIELVAQGATEAGLEYLRKTVELDPWQFNAQLRLGWCYVALEDLDGAESAFEAADGISPGSVRSLAALAFIAARKGDEARARELLLSVLPLAEALDDPFDVAIVYVGLEDRENSIAWITQAARATRTLHMAGPWGIQAPIFDWLRDDERFAQIERDIFATTRRRQPAGGDL